MRLIYGYDRHMKPIYHGSIVRFRDIADNSLRVGHVWQGEDWEADDENARCWNVSFNHTYSESSQSIKWGRDYRVIGDVERWPEDERLLDFDHHCMNGRGGWMSWTPYPHWI